MHKIIPQVGLVGIPGSLREASFSRATLVGLRNNLPDKVTLDILDLQLPLYNEDNDHPDGPADVRRFRDAIQECDGVVIATPEYNHGIPGVLKKVKDGTLVDEASLSFALASVRRMISLSRQGSQRLPV
jgi:chromate reductase